MKKKKQRYYTDVNGSIKKQVSARNVEFHMEVWCILSSGTGRSWSCFIYTYVSEKNILPTSSLLYTFFATFWQLLCNSEGQEYSFTDGSD